MEYQINELIKICMEKGDSVLNIEEFTSEHVKNRKIPVNVQTVLNDIHRTGKVMKISSDELVRVIPAQNNGGDWLTWGYRNFIKPPVSWGIRKIFPTGRPIYVIKDIIKDKCTRLLDRHYCEVLCDITDSVVEFRKLLERNTDICKSDLEFHLVIHELTRQNKVTVQQDNQHVIVKFCCRTDSRVKPIQRSDLDIFRVKVVSDGLNNRIENLSKDTERLTVEARKHKKNKKIQQAVKCLKRRRLLNKRLNQLTSSLDILEDMLEKLRHAVSNEMILKAVQSGVCVLKEYNDKINVDLLNGSVTEVFEQHSELNSLIEEMFSKMPTTSSNTQEELEEELNDILLNDQTLSKTMEADKQNAEDNESHTRMEEDTESNTKMEELLDTRLPDVPHEAICEDKDTLQLSCEATTSAALGNVDHIHDKKRSSEVAHLPMLEECGISHSDKWLSLPKSNKRRVLILHKPPSNLICQEIFTNVMELGKKESKWLLVNIQNVHEYVCQIQNKDLWCNDKVIQIVKEHFIFWQANHDSTEGEKYTSQFEVKEWPYTAIVDPRNGKRMVTWNKIDPVKLCENIEQFLLENNITDTCSSLSTKKKIKMDTDDSIVAMTDSNILPEHQMTDSNDSAQT